MTTHTVTIPLTHMYNVHVSRVTMVVKVDVVFKTTNILYMIVTCLGGKHVISVHIGTATSLCEHSAKHN